MIPSDLRNALAVVVYKRIGSLLHLHKCKCRMYQRGFLSGLREMVCSTRGIKRGEVELEGKRLHLVSDINH